jgi:hypothetical protein
MECKTLNPDSSCKEIAEEDQKASSSKADLIEKFEVIVDENAEAVDWDEAMAEFLLAYIKRNRKEGRYPYEFSTN